jgi:hypothetical protein
MAVALSRRSAKNLRKNLQGVAHCTDVSDTDRRPPNPLTAFFVRVIKNRTEKNIRAHAEKLKDECKKADVYEGFQG